jgi:hypothetical protein
MLGEIIGRARWTTSCEVRWRPYHGHPHPSHYPNGDHVRSGPVFWTDAGIKALRDDIDRRLGSVDFELDIRKGR